MSNYTITTTPGYVFSTQLQGEANLTAELFTRDLGRVFMRVYNACVGTHASVF